MIENTNLRLDEIGERAIIERILLPRYSSQGVSDFGNDCAFVVDCGSLDGKIVATTDPCPEPVASILGFSDFYYRGWLLAAINLSDLAAAGARPLGLLTSLILTNDTTVDQFVRLLDGIDDCCRRGDTHVIGGNLKEANKIDLSATAIGVCDKGLQLSRIGCQTGDLVVVIGDLGCFWAGVLSMQRGLPLHNSEKSLLLQNVLTPLPKTHIAQRIAKQQLMTACIDNSDGLYPSLIQLAKANNLQMHIKMDDVVFPDAVLHVASMLNIEPIRFALGWGDWQLIGCVAPKRLNELKRIGEESNISVSIIGVVKEGQGVFLEHREHIAEMIHLDSERFTKKSWFTAGLESYIDMVVNAPLWNITK